MLLLTTPFVKTDPESTNVADNKRQSINDYLAESTILLFLDILVESIILSHRGILLNFTQANSQDPTPPTMTGAKVLVYVSKIDKKNRLNFKIYLSSLQKQQHSFFCLPSVTLV